MHNSFWFSSVTKIHFLLQKKKVGRTPPPSVDGPEWWLSDIQPMVFIVDSPVTF